MVALDHVKDFASKQATKQDELFESIKLEYSARSGVQNNRTLLINAHALALKLHEMVIKHLEYEKDGMKKHVQQEYEPLTEDEKSLYNSIRREPLLRMPNLRQLFIDVINEEGIMKQVRLNPRRNDRYDTMA